MSNQAFINQAIAKAIAIADRKTAEAASYSQQAVDAANLTVDLGAGTISFVPTVKLTQVPDASLVLPTGIDDLTDFPSLISEIQNGLVNNYAQFFADYFPNDTDILTNATMRLDDMLTSGSILPANYEDAVWQRDRDRILTDFDRSVAETVDAWAGRGFPLPPGGANMSIIMLRNKADTEVAASSRDRAIQQIALGNENLKFAIKQTIDFRIQAIQSVGDYIRALALGPQLAAELLNTQINAKAKLAEITTSYYTARVTAASEFNRNQIALESLRYDPIKGSVDNNVRLNIAYGDDVVRIANARSVAAAGAAVAAGNQGAAALSQLNTIATIEAQDS